jgi:5-methyltetrahydrofolate corrinoid/iron sulfur protein methyltransferase
MNKHLLTLLLYEGLTAAIADAAEITETAKTVDVIMGKILYAHSYLEM